MNLKLAKYLLILFSFLQPIIILYFFGEDFKSFSKVDGTFLEPMFIIINACTSFFFFEYVSWRIPSILLLLLTAFSTNLFPNIHNIISVLFFISCFLALKNNTYSKIFIIFVILGGLKSLFFAEMLAIYVLNIYHLKILIKKFC